MKFSIIIPVYNAEKYIGRTINSVLQQSYSDYEVILIDDGSKDNSSEILDRYAEKEEKIIVKHIHNQGVSHARNEGITLARGEYILFLDADDEYEKHALGCIEDALRIYNSPDFLCFGYNEYLFKNNKIVREKGFSYNSFSLSGQNELREFAIDLVTNAMFGSVWSKAYKRELLVAYNIRMPEEMYVGEDYCFNLKVLEHSCCFVAIKDYLYKYMIQNQDSIIRKYNPKKFEQMYIMHTYRTRFLNDIACGSESEKNFQIRMNFIRLCISCFMDLSRKECNYSFAQKIHYIHEHRNIEQERYNPEYTKYMSRNQKIIYKIFMNSGDKTLYIFSKLCFYLKFYLGKSL